MTLHDLMIANLVIGVFLGIFALKHRAYLKSKDLL
jgi:hypothetical protein